MKPIHLPTGLLLAAVGVAVACGGVSTIGQGEEGLSAPQLVGGSYNAPAPGVPRAGAETGPSVTFGGSGSTAEVPMSAGGEDASGGSNSMSNGPVCQYDMECPVVDHKCSSCGDGSFSCPVGQCVAGACQTIVPACSPFEPCKDQPCGAMCLFVCPDGNCPTNVDSYCDGNGQCQQGVPKCSSSSDQCQTVQDCPPVADYCVMCAANICAKYDCIAGQCAYGCPALLQTRCVNTGDCAPTSECQQCMASGVCAAVVCLQGICTMTCPQMP